MAAEGEQISDDDERTTKGLLSVVVNFESLRFMTLIKVNYLISDLITEVEKTFTKLYSSKVKIKTLKNSVNAVLPDWYPVVPLIKNGDEIFAFSDAAADVVNTSFVRPCKLPFSRNTQADAKSSSSSAVVYDSGFSSRLEARAPLEENRGQPVASGTNGDARRLTTSAVFSDTDGSEDSDSSSNSSETFSAHNKHPETVPEDQRPPRETTANVEKMGKVSQRNTGDESKKVETKPKKSEKVQSSETSTSAKESKRAENSRKATVVEIKSDRSLIVKGSVQRVDKVSTLAVTPARQSSKVKSKDTLIEVGGKSAATQTRRASTSSRNSHVTLSDSSWTSDEVYCDIKGKNEITVDLEKELGGQVATAAKTSMDENSKRKKGQDVSSESSSSDDDEVEEMAVDGKDTLGGLNTGGKKEGDSALSVESSHERRDKNDESTGNTGQNKKTTPRQKTKTDKIKIDEMGKGNAGNVSESNSNDSSSSSSESSAEPKRRLTQQSDGKKAGARKLKTDSAKTNIDSSDSSSTSTEQSSGQVFHKNTSAKRKTVVSEKTDKCKLTAKKDKAKTRVDEEESSGDSFSSDIPFTPAAGKSSTSTETKTTLAQQTGKTGGGNSEGNMNEDDKGSITDGSSTSGEEKPTTKSFSVGNALTNTKKNQVSQPTKTNNHNAKAKATEAHSSSDEESTDGSSSTSAVKPLTQDSSKANTSTKVKKSPIPAAAKMNNHKPNGKLKEMDAESSSDEESSSGSSSASIKRPLTQTPGRGKTSVESKKALGPRAVKTDNHKLKSLEDKADSDEEMSNGSTPSVKKTFTQVLGKDKTPVKSKKTPTPKSAKTDNSKQKPKPATPTADGKSLESGFTTSLSETPFIFSQKSTRNAMGGNTCGKSNNKGNTDVVDTEMIGKMSNSQSKKKNDPTWTPKTAMPKTPKREPRPKDPKKTPRLPESPDTQDSRKSALDKSASKVASWLLANEVSGYPGTPDETQSISGRYRTRAQKAKKRAQNQQKQNKTSDKLNTLGNGKKSSAKVQKNEGSTAVVTAGADAKENGKAFLSAKNGEQPEKRKLDAVVQGAQTPGRNAKNKKLKKKAGDDKNQAKTQGTIQADKNDGNPVVQLSQESSKRKITSWSLPKNKTGLSALFEDDSDFAGPSQAHKIPKVTPAVFDRRQKPTGFLTPSSSVKRKPGRPRAGWETGKKMTSSQPNKPTEMNKVEKDFLASGPVNLETLLNDEAIEW